MLLDVLTDNPGSIEVENAYLQALQAMAQIPRSGEFSDVREPMAAIGSR